VIGHPLCLRRPNEGSRHIFAKRYVLFNLFNERARESEIKQLCQIIKPKRVVVIIGAAHLQGMNAAFVESGIVNIEISRFYGLSV
jgi:hypothetical protein